MSKIWQYILDPCLYLYSWNITRVRYSSVHVRGIPNTTFLFHTVKLFILCLDPPIRGTQETEKMPTTDPQSTLVMSLFTRTIGTPSRTPTISGSSTGTPLETSTETSTDSGSSSGSPLETSPIRVTQETEEMPTTGTCNGYYFNKIWCFFLYKQLVSCLLPAV